METYRFWLWKKPGKLREFFLLLCGHPRLVLLITCRVLVVVGLVFIMIPSCNLSVNELFCFLSHHAGAFVSVVNATQ